MPKRQYTYRFKTDEEFRKEFGPHWGERVRCSWVSQMDWALGKTIENEKRRSLQHDGSIITSYNYDIIDKIFSDDYGDYNFHYSIGHLGFTASLDMMVKEQTTPTYERRKFVY